LAVAASVLAARAPHIVFTGGAGHQQYEDVANPGGVLGVKPAGEQDSQQVLGQDAEPLRS